MWLTKQKRRSIAFEGSDFTTNFDANLPAYLMMALAHDRWHFNKHFGRSSAMTARFHLLTKHWEQTSLARSGASVAGWSVVMTSFRCIQSKNVIFYERTVTCRCITSKSQFSQIITLKKFIFQLHELKKFLKLLLDETSTTFMVHNLKR